MCSYLPALKYHFLTRFYDLGIRLTLPETRIKRHLVEEARIQDGQRVLDLGCGTGTLLILAKKLFPGADYVGVDPDAQALHMARRKADRAGIHIDFELGSATQLPLVAGSFDRVLSSLVLHHLEGESKGIALAEAHRILRPRGEIHLLDFGYPDGPFMRAIAWLVEKIGREHVQENFAGRLPDLMASAGFNDIEETAKFNTIFSTMRSYRGLKPETGAGGF